MNSFERYILAPHHNKRWLEGKYLDEGLSGREIASLCNVCHTIIYKWMKRFDINRREKGATNSKWNNRMYRNRFYLIQQYKTLGLSTSEIAKKEDVYPSVIRHWMIIFHIKRKNQGRYRRKKNANN